MRRYTLGLASLALGCWFTPTDWDELRRDASVRADVDAVVPPGFGSYVVEMSFAGVTHACVRMSDGRVRCRGANSSGQLGTGTTDNYSVPVVVEGIRDAEQIVTGPRFSCVRLRDRTVRCWGDNSELALGLPTGDDSGTLCGTRRCRRVPTAVPGMTGVVQLATMESTVCAVRDDRTVWCWGGGPGPGEPADLGARLPQRVAILHDVAALRAGGGTWFVEGPGGTTTAYGRLASVALPTGARIDTLESTHLSTVCFRLPDFGVRCVGEQLGGVLGNGRDWEAEIREPVNPGLTGVTSIATSATHSCAVRNDGTLWCWGSNQHGALGVGALRLETCMGRPGYPRLNYACSLEPLRVWDIASVERVFVGNDSTCAVRYDHTLLCWGRIRPEDTGSTVSLWFNRPAERTW